MYPTVSLVLGVHLSETVKRSIMRPGDYVPLLDEQAQALLRGRSCARAAEGPRLDAFSVVALLFACSSLVVAASVCEFKVCHASCVSFSTLRKSLG